MNDMTPTSAERAEKLEGMGCRRKRVEDIRFVQGKGNYVDDIKMPGMLYGDFNAFAACACAHQEHRHQQGRGGARRGRGAHRRDAQDRQPRLDADARRRRADGAGRRQGAVPEPGGRVRDRDRPLRGGRRRRPRGGRVRAIALQRRPAQGYGRERAGDPRGPARQEFRLARRAQASQSHLQLAGRRQGRDRCGLRQSRRDDQGADRLSALPSIAAGDLPVRRLVRQDQERADAVRHVPGAACDPHRRLADLEDPRAQDPRDRARHRRRLRQQGRRLSGLHLRHRRLDRHRQAGEMGRRPHREPLHHGLRARLPHGGRDRLHQGRQGARRSAATRSPTTARSTPAPMPANGRPACSASSPARTTSRPRTARSTASTPTRRRAASPIAARSASPRRPTASSAPWTSWRRS